MEYKNIEVVEKNGVIKLTNPNMRVKPKITIKLSKYRTVLENYVKTLSISKLDAIFLFAQENYSRFTNFQNKQDFYRLLTEEDLQNNVAYVIRHTNGNKYTFYDEKQLITCSKEYFNITMDGKMFLEYNFGKRVSPNIADTEIYWLPKEKRLA